MRRMVGVVAAVALVAAANSQAVDREHWINAISIGRAELGYPAEAYVLLFGKPSERSSSKLVFGRRAIIVYLDRNGRGAALLTRNRRDKTLDSIGPCSAERALRRAYPNAPFRNGRYVLGRLSFYVNGGRVVSVLLALPSVRKDLANYLLWGCA